MSKKILIIDDDIQICDEISDLLRDTGYSVSTINSGLEGNILINKYHYDLLLLDLKLPDISGFQILKCLKKNNINLPVIVMTGNNLELQMSSGGQFNNDEEEEQYQSLKIAGKILNKPIDISILLETIEKILFK